MNFFTHVVSADDVSRNERTGHFAGDGQALLPTLRYLASV
jgi:hypothetical protein